MDVAISSNNLADIISKVKVLSNNCRVSKLEEMLSDCFETMQNSKVIDYVGEFNKNDVMS